MESIPVHSWNVSFAPQSSAGLRAGESSHNRPLGFQLQGTRLDLWVNGKAQSVPDEWVEAGLPLLWALRDVLGLTGTKFGCGVSACGACTVHVDGQAVRSCVTTVASVGGRRVTTIEALGSAGQPHPLQKAWIEHQVPQCGYCQSGMLMAAAALLARNPNPNDADVDAAITNICRCGTYPRIRIAIQSAAKALRGSVRPPRNAKG
jgi:isoquinoline 1-oxidoreductase subunit alpha